MHTPRGELTAVSSLDLYLNFRGLLLGIREWKKEGIEEEREERSRKGMATDFIFYFYFIFYK